MYCNATDQTRPLKPGLWEKFGRVIKDILTGTGPGNKESLTEAFPVIKASLTGMVNVNNLFKQESVASIFNFSSMILQFSLQTGS